MHRRDIMSQTPQMLHNDHYGHFTSVSTSPTRCRDQLGVEKLLSSRMKKKALEEVELISNKINLLMKLDKQAKKKAERAQKIAEDIEKIRRRNELKVKEMEIWKDIKKKDEEEQRRKNQDEVYRRKQAKKQLELSILREKQEIANFVKKNVSEMDEETRSNKNMIRHQNTQIKINRITEVIRNKAKNATFTRQFTQNLKQEYEDRISKEKNAYLDILNKKKILEAQELKLIEDYSRTIDNEKEALKRLGTITKVPLQSLGYTRNIIS